ncbi:MAG: caspase family protein [Saprospiraceae bacterium]|nr:caspase family protein [Saprospiraceae bacterium]
MKTHILFSAFFLVGSMLSAQTKPELQIQSGVKGDVSSLFFSPDGKYLCATGLLESSVLDLSSYSQVSVIKESLQKNCSFIFNNHYILETGDNYGVWNVTTGERIVRSHKNAVAEFVFSKDSSKIFYSNAYYLNGGLNAFDDFYKQLQAMQSDLEKMTETQNNNNTEKGDKKKNKKTAGDILRSISNAVNITDIIPNNKAGEIATDAATVLSQEGEEPETDIFNFGGIKPDKNIWLHDLKTNSSKIIYAIQKNEWIDSIYIDESGFYLNVHLIKASFDSELAKLFLLKINLQSYLIDKKLLKSDIRTTEIINKNENYLSEYTDKALTSANSFNVASTKNYVATYNMESGMIIIKEKPSGMTRLSIQEDKNVSASMLFSPNGNYLMFRKTDISLSGEVKIWDLRKKEMVFKASETVKEIINTRGFSPDSKYFLYTSYPDNNTFSTTMNINIVDLTTGKIVQQFEGGNAIGYSPDGRYLVHNNANMELVFRKINKQESTETRLASEESTKLFKPTKQYYISDIGFFSADGSQLIVGAYGELFLWDWKNFKITKSQALEYGTRRVFSPNNKYYASVLAINAAQENSAVQIKIKELNTGVVQKINIDNEVVDLYFTSDNKHFAIKTITQDRKIVTTKIFRTTNGQLVETFGNNLEFYDISPDGKKIIISVKGEDGVAVLDINSKARLDFIPSATEVKIASNGKMAIVKKLMGLFLYDMDKKKEIGKIDVNGLFTRTLISPDGSYAIIFDGVGYLSYDFQLKKTKKLGNLPVLNQSLMSSFQPLAFSPDSRFLALTNNEGGITMYDIKQQKILFNFFGKGENDFIITIPENYYMATPGAIKQGLGFKLEGNSFPFEQFDLKYNRPDLVLEHLGTASPELVQAYRNAYYKRLKKMGFSESMLTEVNHIPEVKVVSTSLSTITSNRRLHFEVRALDKKANLDRIQVFVNDVSIYGLQGLDLKYKATKNIVQAVDVVLSQGQNKIQVFAINQYGAESLRETFNVTYDGPRELPTLYLITMEASAYQNAEYNLTYPAKDARDFQNLIAGKKSVYKAIVSKHLTSREITTDNINNLKTILRASQVDDQVIVFYSGHGLIDQDLDYYLAGFHTDFNNPQKGGIPVETLEMLLDGIPARQKLILIDACHSGEIDKESVALIRNKQVQEGTVKFRSVNTTLVSPHLGLENSFELMKELFVDLRRGTGATIISSAGGTEFAMEGAKWKNGVFTYCLLRGLSEKIADLDKNGQVMISELEQYLSVEVPKLTDNHQRPTMRLENISNDWRIW